MKDIANTTLSDILPPPIADDEEMAVLAEVVDEEIARAVAEIKKLNFLSRIDELEEPLLSYLAWQFHVDYWPDDFTLAQKRTAVKRSLIRHMKKGTPAAVEEAVAEVMGDATVTEWFEYGGEPYRFKIETTGSIPTYNAFERVLLPVIERTKNERSRLEGVRIRRGLHCGIVMARAVVVRRTIRINAHMT